MNLSLRRKAKHTAAGVRAAASAAEIAQPAGRRSAQDEPAVPAIGYDAGYDHPGWDDTDQASAQDQDPAAASWEGAQDPGQPARDPESTLLMPVAALAGARPAAAAVPAEEDGKLPRRTRQPGPRPQVPPLSPEDRAVLGQVLDGLCNLPDAPENARPRAAMAAPEPAAWLRAIMPGRRSPWDTLPGQPSFAGIIRDPDGLPYAGLYLGEPDDDGRMVIDVRDPRWLRDLIGAAHEAADALEAAGAATAGAGAAMATRTDIPAVPAAEGVL